MYQLQHSIKKSTGLVLLLFFCYTLPAQTYFNKRFDFFHNGNYSGYFDTLSNSFIIPGAGYDTTTHDFKMTFLNVNISDGNVIYSKSYGEYGQFWESDAIVHLGSNNCIASLILSKGSGTQAGLVYFDMSCDTQKTILFFDTAHISIISNLKRIKSSKLIACGLYDSVGIDNANFLLMKMDTSGNLLWFNTYGLSSNNQHAYGLDTCQDGGFIMAGLKQNGNSYQTMVVKTDSLGNQKWLKYYSNYCGTTATIRTLKDGNYLLATSYLDSFSVSNMSYFTRTYLIKMDTSGNIIWDRYYQTMADGNYPANCMELGNKELIIIGTEGGGAINGCAPNRLLGYIMKTDSVGNIKFYHTYTADTSDVSSYNYLYDIKQMPDNGFVAVGMVTPFCDGTTQDTWILRVDSNGCEVPGCDITGLEQHRNKTYKLEAFPNPTTGYLTANYTIDDPSCTNATLQLTEIATGRVVMKKDVSCTSTQAQIDMNGFADGVYSLSIQSNLTMPKNIRIIKVQ